MPNPHASVSFTIHIVKLSKATFGLCLCRGIRFGTRIFRVLCLQNAILISCKDIANPALTAESRHCVSVGGYHSPWMKLYSIEIKTP